MTRPNVKQRDHLSIAHSKSHAFPLTISTSSSINAETRSSAKMPSTKKSIKRDPDSASDSVGEEEEDVDFQNEEGGEEEEEAVMSDGDSEDVKPKVSALKYAPRDGSEQSGGRG